jgi:hypothetical protein
MKEKKINKGMVKEKKKEWGELLRVYRENLGKR